jgi:hypothetical protein
VAGSTIAWGVQMPLYQLFKTMAYGEASVESFELFGSFANVSASPSKPCPRNISALQRLKLPVDWIIAIVQFDVSCRQDQQARLACCNP